MNKQQGGYTLSVESKATIAYIGLGSNSGARDDNIQTALKMLDESKAIRVVRASDTIETPPLAGMDQPDYLNAAAKIETSLSAQQLLDQLTRIEDSLGRQRTEKWGPRTIDLDILLFGDETIKTKNLTIPHAQMHLRSFVLKPLSQIAPDVIHPLLKRSTSCLLERLNSADHIIDENLPQLICIAGVIGVGKTTLAEGLGKLLSCEVLKEAYDTNPYITDACDGDIDAALNSQLYFLESRLDQLSSDKLLPGKTYIADYVFAKDRIFAERTLTAEQLATYNQQHCQIKEKITPPVLAIYMSDSPESILDRIHNRNRPYEQRIEIASIRSLSESYDRLFADWQTCPVIRLSVGDFDARVPTNIEKLNNEMKYYLARCK